MTQLTLTVNGEERCLNVPPSRYLAEVLRYDLGLTGTKIGCDEAECGCCTVIVDGQSVDSCIYPAFKAQGAQVLTIEGLAQMRPDSQDDPNCAPELHPLQDAFIRHGATQCGFCTPGFIMQAKTLLDENPDPSEVEIKECLKDTYCRCTGYTAIISSVKAASEYLRTGRMPDAVLPPVMKPLTQIGQPLQRPDAVDKVTGAALYTDDYRFDGMLFGATLRSEHPHARIRSIDADAARALEGVHAVLTHADVPGDPRHGLVENDWPVFAGGRYPARYVGDAIALAVAETAEIAQQALALIGVDYEVLEAVTDPRDALQPDAPQLHPDRPDGNLLKHIKVRHGDVEAGFAASDVVVERTYRTPMTEHAFLEPECALAVPAGYSGVRPSTSKERGAAEYDSDKLTVYVGSQIPYSDRRQVAKSLGLDDEEVRVIGTLMGGGFGGKEDIAGQIHAALAAQVTGRPVKILYSRQESLIFHPKRHSTIIRIKTGALRDGTLVAVEAELYGDSGAYASLGEKVMTRATTHATGPYVMPHARIDCYAMYTNNAPSGAFRGFGVTQSAFAVESNLDILAAELGMDPTELRRKNVMRVGVETATGQELVESVGLLECLDKVEEEIKRSEDVDPNSLPSDPWTPVQIGSKRYAWGIAAGYKNTGLGGGAPDKAEAEVEVFPDGTAAIRTSSAEMGQNLVGVLAACTAQELGLPFEKVHVTVMDTDLTPDGGPSTASRQTYVSGNAARLAARAMRQQMQNVLAEKFDTHPEVIAFHEGLAYVDERRLAKMHGAELPVEGADGTNGSAGGILPGSTRSVSFADAVNALLAENRLPKIRYEYWAPQTQPLGTGGDMHFAFSYAVHAAQVSVDTDTGEVAVERVISAHDVGRAINPLSLLGQIEGGIVMGIGNALTENYIVEDGVPWTERLGQYKMPGIKMTPKMDSHIVEHPTADGPYGAKGVGEISSIPISPAITNAICNAVGVRCLALPVDQDALLLAMRDGEKEIDGHWGQTGEWLVVSNGTDVR
ncbi:MAG: molybdopterin-dependent oxidoreductase [Caldilineaceae bacterium SB0675_bin_29]|uniref:Molybdopterin-dependent oxidoreductase n=1 Tax=Caldilineaceae bacterium SB0675_bin_29 TaxID=2605266 RepID=A0A6B1FTB0_9CHLR|nr:molybdopterin-dependent oxidoreductase [Caldilineaceae bacterium SB0675_bin_29]